MTKSVEERPVVKPVGPDSPGDSEAGRGGYPKKFGHYEIQRELGRGGMATVYEAIDTKLQRKVALKVPHKAVAADPEYMSRFLREARSAATLFHPNICPVFEVGEISGTPYLTMAFIEGKNLSDYIVEEQPLPPKRVANIVRKIAQAMDVAHKQGIVHRDLKPSNIMIDGRKEPVIMDFGLARRDGGTEESKLTQDGLLIGTPIYMAPEVAKKGAAFSGPITDVYSLGAILYELLSGKPPYKGTVQAVLVQVMRGTPKPPSTHRPDLDPMIEAVCLRAMAKSPEDRYPTMADFAVALKEYIQNADSAPSNLVEIVEVEPTPPPARRQDADSGRSQGDRKSAVDRTPSPTSRSAASLSGRRTVRRPPKKDDSLKLVAILVSVAVLGIGALVAIIIVAKNLSRDVEKPIANTPPATAPTADAVTPPAPTPPKDDVASYPLVDATHPIAPGVDKVRVASNFQGLIPVQFPKVQASEGRYVFYIPRVTINGKSIDVHDKGEFPMADKLWPHLQGDNASKNLQDVNPTYNISSDWLGAFKEGDKIPVEVIVGLFYPPKNEVFPSKTRRFTIYVVKPEAPK